MEYSLRVTVEMVKMDTQATVYTYQDYVRIDGEKAFFTGRNNADTAARVLIKFIGKLLFTRKENHEQ